MAATGPTTVPFSVLNANRPPVAYASAAPPIAYDGMPSVLLRATAPAGRPVSNDPDGDALVLRVDPDRRSRGDAGQRELGHRQLHRPSRRQRLHPPVPASSVRDRTNGRLEQHRARGGERQPELRCPPSPRWPALSMIVEHGQVLLDGSTSSERRQRRRADLCHGPSSRGRRPSPSAAKPAAPSTFDAPSADDRAAMACWNSSCWSSDTAVHRPVRPRHVPGADRRRHRRRWSRVPADIDTEATSAADAMPVDLQRRRAGCGRRRAALPVAGDRLHAAVGDPVRTGSQPPPVASMTTAVTCSATDLAGNAGQRRFDVTVQRHHAAVHDRAGFASASKPPARPVAHRQLQRPDVRRRGRRRVMRSCAPASGSTFPARHDRGHLQCPATLAPSTPRAPPFQPARA